MPHKYNAQRRHRIPKRRYKVTNWQAYEAGLRQRGSLTIWFTDEAIATWRAPPRTTPGGQARYSDLAIETSLILRTVFHQPLRQTEGLVGSLLELMGLDLPVPDHTTLSRRSRTLAVAPQIRTGPSKDWGCGVGQGMTGRVFDRLGIKDGMGFAPGGDWGRWVEPKRRRDGDRPVR